MASPLIPAAAELDPHAIFTQQLRTALVRFVSSRVRDPHLAEELTQQILLRAAEKLPALRQTSRIEAWIFAIARNVVSDHFRRQRPTLPFDEERDGGESPEDHESRELELLRGGVNDYLRQVVTSLPPIYREAIELTDYAGLSQVEMARRLGISISGAKSRVQRARAEVRRIIEACCHFEMDRYGSTVDCTPRHPPSCQDCS